MKRTLKLTTATVLLLGATMAHAFNCSNRCYQQIPSGLWAYFVYLPGGVIRTGASQWATQEECNRDRLRDPLCYMYPQRSDEDTTSRADE